MTTKVRKPEPLFKHGDTLWYKPFGAPGRSITIEAVGRKWMTTSMGVRVHQDTLLARRDGRQAGQCWISEEASRAQQEVDAAWWSLRHRVHSSHGTPPGMSVRTVAILHELIWPSSASSGST